MLIPQAQKYTRWQNMLIPPNCNYPIAASSNIYFIYKKLLQTFQKSVSLVKIFFLVNSFISVFCGILHQVLQQLFRKTPLIFDIFPIIPSICCSYLIVYYLIKPLWSCVNASQTSCSGCCSLSLWLSVWPSMWRISICRFHMTIFVGAVSE